MGAWTDAIVTSTFILKSDCLFGGTPLHGKPNFESKYRVVNSYFISFLRIRLLSDPPFPPESWSLGVVVLRHIGN